MNKWIPKIGDQIGCVMFKQPEETAIIIAINNKTGAILVSFHSWINGWKGPFSQREIDSIKKWTPEVVYDDELMKQSIGKTAEWIWGGGNENCIVRKLFSCSLTSGQCDRIKE